MMPSTIPATEHSSVALNTLAVNHKQVEAYLDRLINRFIADQPPIQRMVGDVHRQTLQPDEEQQQATILFVATELGTTESTPDYLSGNSVPELIIMMITVSEHWNTIREQLVAYFASGVERVWVVDPEQRVVWVYHGLSEVYQLSEGDILTGEGTLTGFQVSVDNIFAARRLLVSHSAAHTPGQVAPFHKRTYKESVWAGYHAMS